jgi:ligand-binding sensor domain-containing protein/signal transduction histidine kinase
LDDNCIETGKVTNNNMRFLIILLAGIAFLPHLNVFGQAQHIVQNQLKFKYLTVDDGLSNNHVQSITEDAYGFIWIATDNGINRFDGQNIIQFRHIPEDTNSILSNIVKVVYADGHNNLWVGSQDGLNLFDYNLNNFTKFRHKDLKEPLGEVEDIAEDRQGKIWIGSTNGLFYFDIKNQSLGSYKSSEKINEGLPTDHIYRIMADRYNNLWLSCYDKGICIFNQQDQTFKCYVTETGNEKSLSDIRIERFYEDSEGNIWIGTYSNGLNLFNPVQKNFTRLIPDPDNSYSSRVRTFFEDNRNNFFAGTRGGLYLWGKKERKFIHYAYSEHKFSILNSNSILCSYISKNGVLWLGTFAGGVNYSDLYRKSFVLYRSKPDDIYFLNTPNVYSILEDNDQHVWIGTDNGLNKLNQKTNTFQYYVNIPGDKNSLSYNDVKALALDEKGNLWIGTNNGGLDYYNQKLKIFKHYKSDSSDINSLACNKIYGLLYDSQKALWILSNSNIDNQFSNIDILLKGSNRFIHLKEKAYFGITECQSGDIWIGSIGGVWHFNRLDSVFTLISNESMIGKVYTVKEDSRNNIWIGSDLGLTKYETNHETFTHFQEDQGQPFDIVYGILEDKQKNLWVSTNYGLVKFINAVEDKDSIAFRVYDKQDGLQSRQFNYNACFVNNHGEMFFGGINGFNAFYPENISDNPFKPKVLITGLKIFNNDVKIGAQIYGKVILKKAINETDTLKLSYKIKTFTLEFAALHYSMPEKNQYKYFLKGFDKTWQNVTHRNDATYTNLQPRKYTFMVMASNNDGKWDEVPASIIIIITPPFWHTALFKISFVLLVMSLFSGIYLYRVNRLKRQQIHLESLVKQRTSEVEEKNNKLLEQTYLLNETNTLLEERQQQIEEQSEELRTQKEELESTNEYLNSTNSLLEERQKNIEEQAEALRIQADELSLKNNSLQKLNATKNKFFSIIAHDLKNPFNVILGFSELLSEKYDNIPDTKRKQYIELIFNSVTKIYKLLENLLQWARFQSDNIPCIPEELMLTDLIDTNLELSANQINNKNLKIEKDIPPDLKIYADKNMINTVVRNLLTNAIKFTENGCIKINGLKAENFVTFSITDTGTGIQESKLEKIFEIDNSKSTEGTKGESGTGLGLIICREFVEKNGGSIYVTSKEGKGSSFSVTLPAKYDE